MAHVFVVGGTGFIGPHLIKAFLEKGYQVTALVRSEKKASHLPKGVHQILGDPMRPGPWQGEVKEAEVIVNLAGANIFARWTSGYKRLIFESRLFTTQNIVQALQGPGHGKVLLQASAVGYYGADRGEEEVTEETPAGGDFLAQVCKAWEEAALAGQRYGLRVCLMRIGVVLGPDGGALAKMLPAFKLGLGGPIGSGRQWFPWIHIKDMVRAAIFLVENKGICGPFNFTAPGIVRNRDLAKTLGQVLKRPAFLPAPALVLRVLFGEMAQVLLGGVKALPRRLMEAGYQFLFPDLASALRDLCQRA